MNIKIVDSWLREFLKTKATPDVVAKELSLKSVSVDRIEKVNDDYIYDIEITTNRPDLMSVKAIAKEASAVLEDAEFNELKTDKIQTSDNKFPIEIKNDPKLVNRICAVVMEIQVAESPSLIKTRLEKSGIRSLNNLIDVTNYVMREIGHPAHVFDYDLITTKKMVIRASKPGEKITTLDDKTHTLLGEDIVADNGKGEIIDLLGIMGTKNSVVRQNTKRILLFLDNNNPKNIRRTSMSLGIRTEAAIINEKGIDPELTMKALTGGVRLYEQIASGKVISEILDIYPNKSKTHIVKVSNKKVNRVIGIELNPTESSQILEKLGFRVKKSNEYLEVNVPTIRSGEVLSDEDVIEEIARVYGYHKLPSIIPTFLSDKNVSFTNDFYFEQRAKNALKYWGFTEVYTYSLVSEDMFEGPIEEAVKLKNPLSQDLGYLRNTLIPSLLKVEKENPAKESLKIFEIANVYLKNNNNLPDEVLMLAGLIKKPHVNFYEVKGIVEQVLADLGIKNLEFKKSQKGGSGASLFIEKDYIGEIELLDTHIIDFELNFKKILKYATVKKNFRPFAKFPPAFEDISVIADLTINTQELINTIESQSEMIVNVTLKDIFENSRTFHLTYQDFDKNLTREEVAKIRGQIISKLKEKYNARIRE
ncbi:MAG: phenylalanine--tRNA ligase subunit beta [Candidatus Levybacteria bacterium CG10_big_fil_rev_8_21_14_0_10_35_13]|nr:MAG: phenylalanine--tRNA ligase subunit beta [Candidatus Levybacteria bacterium CG10_big_fil_rev_8_21_14_0_10_35_13]